MYRAFSRCPAQAVKDLLEVSWVPMEKAPGGELPKVGSHSSGGLDGLKLCSSTSNNVFFGWFNVPRSLHKTISGGSW